MGYVILGIVVLLLVAGFVTYLVMMSMRKGNPVARDTGTPNIGPDGTPLGDTTQHAGKQSERGTTAEDPERNPGEDSEADEGDEPARPARPEDRQLGDSGAQTGPTVPQPESERLANGPR
jgi:hypothetical protein